MTFHSWALLPMLGSRGAGQWGSGGGQATRKSLLREWAGGWGRACFGPGPTVCGQTEMFTGGSLVSPSRIQALVTQPFLTVGI